MSDGRRRRRSRRSRRGCGRCSTDDPELPAVVIAERVGWTGSITWFRQNVKRLRPEHRKIDPADRLDLGAGRRGAVRPVVPAAEDPPRGRHGEVAAGARDHRRVLAVHPRPDDPDPTDRGSAARVVGAHPTARTGPAPADLGQRAGHRARPAPSRGCRVVHGDAGHQARAAAAERPRVQRRRRASQRLVRDVVHAGAAPSRRRRTSPSSSRLARAGERPDGAHDQGRAGRAPRSSTGPRCWRCRRSRSISAGATGSDSAGTTTSGSTPTTTRSTPR